MELHFVYFDNRRNGPIPNKIFNLPDTPCGGLAVKIAPGRFIDIGRIFGDTFSLAIGATYEDIQELREMVVHYREERSRVEFKERLAEYALVSAATPIELALYANDLARGLG